MNRYKVAVYVRVSTEEQALEGYSIAAQKQRLSAYCESQEWEIAGFYVDEGISAKDMNRPELKRMLRDVEEKKVDCILVYRLDRLTRSVLDLYKILEILDKSNCKFKSATEVYDTTSAIGRLFITLVAALAQWERENTGERIRMGRHEKVRQGKYTSNRRPFGYHLNLETGELTEHEEEAPIVRMIYELYNQGHSAPKITKLLNAQAAGKDNWIVSTIMYMLTNPLYKGVLRWNRNSEQYFEVEDAVPALITKELYDQTQRVLESRKDMHPRSIAFDYIFSGVLKCSKCGYPLVGNFNTHKKEDGTISKYKHYRCRRTKFGLCEGVYISEHALEKAFVEHLDALQLPITENAASLEEETDASSQDTQSNVMKIQAELTEIEKRRKKWQYAWANEMIGDEDFSKRMKEESEKERILKERLEEFSPAEESIDLEKMLNIIQNIKNNWQEINDREKKTLVQILLKRIVVERREDKKRAVRITEIEFN